MIYEWFFVDSCCNEKKYSKEKNQLIRIQTLDLFSILFFFIVVFLFLIIPPNALSGVQLTSEPFIKQQPIAQVAPKLKVEDLIVRIETMIEIGEINPRYDNAIMVFYDDLDHDDGTIQNWIDTSSWRNMNGNIMTLDEIADLQIELIDARLVTPTA